jgi:DNA-binding NarL/FixJ family response regulator
MQPSKAPAGHPIGEPIRVLGVDDNPLVAEALALRLCRATDFKWVGSLPSADALLETVRDSAPHVVLLDLDMPGREPFAALRELVQTHPNVRVLILSAHIRRDLVNEALAAGALGYISKSEGTASLEDAIRRVAHGELVMSPDVQAVIRAR